MSGLSVGPALAIAQNFEWRRHATFMDLGTAQGELPVILAKAHPHLRGIGFDLSMVRPVFEEFVAGHGLSDLPKGGAVIAYDPILDDDRRENTFGLLASLNMLIETKGGFEYTGADCQAWMREAGFSATRVERLVGGHSIAVGIK